MNSYEYHEKYQGTLDRLAEKRLRKQRTKEFITYAIVGLLGSLIVTISSNHNT